VQSSFTSFSFNPAISSSRNSYARLRCVTTATSAGGGDWALRC